MTDLSAEQNAMLERLCRKNFLGWEGKGEFLADPNSMTALGELLLAVQERDAKLNIGANNPPILLGGHIAENAYRRGFSDALEMCRREIRTQTYADLFLKEE